MKSSCLCFAVFSGFIIMYMLVRGSSGQWFEDPRLTFQNMTFDMVNRASYNTSDCLYDMLQCWEAVKPDMICYRWRWYATICGVMRDYCAESYSDQENYKEAYNIAQGMCEYESYQLFT